MLETSPGHSAHGTHTVQSYGSCAVYELTVYGVRAYVYPQCMFDTDVGPAANVIIALFLSSHGL